MDKLSQNVVAMIANYIIRIGTRKTTTGNFIFFFEELADEFNVSKQAIINSAEDIVNELCKHEEFCLDDQTIDSDSFSVIFYTQYCSSCDEYYQSEDFITDDDKINDFMFLDKIDFMKSYSYLTEYEYDNTIIALWNEFGDVPLDINTECIESDWRIFEAGTHREEIWHWFEEHFNVKVYDLLFGGMTCE